MDMQTSLLDRLFDSGLLIDTGVEGLYGRSGAFEDVIARFERLIDAYGGDDGAEAMRFRSGLIHDRPFGRRVNIPPKTCDVGV